MNARACKQYDIQMMQSQVSGRAMMFHEMEQAIIGQ